MAHPYSSTPLYTGTPSYSPQQQSYYPPYPSNALQPQMQTLQSPGLPQQPMQAQGPPQFATYHPQQPGLAPNGPSFEQNTQVLPPGLQFPPFPPPLNFDSDFFKHIASAGFPPPPPLPNLPPLPIHTPGYPQPHAPLNSSGSSSYPQYSPSGQPAFGSGYAPNEQPGPQGANPYVTPQHGNQGGTDWQREAQTYGAPVAIQGGNVHNLRPISRDVTNVVNDKGM